MDIDRALRDIKRLPVEQQREILGLLEELGTAKSKTKARGKFLNYVKSIWGPAFIEGPHHRIIANLFDEIIAGTKKRIIINMAPRHTKSEFASIHLPSFYLGHYPDRKVIQASNTAELAVGFGRKVRNIISAGEYQSLFPSVKLSADSKAAGRWATNHGGEYFAIGAGGTVSGKGANLFIIDDPHSEQEALQAETNPEIYDKVLEWYESGPRQRLQPDGAIVIVMTRWHQRDLTGLLVKKMMAEPDADQWEIVELPAILPSGNPIWPTFWRLEELLKTKNSIPVSKWNAQYQQNPTAEEGALIKREYWQKWEKKDPPSCDAIIQSWDTAFSKTTRANYSACTTWGVFYNTETETNCLILLDAIRDKWEFPELKAKAKQYYNEWKPDICLIEARAAGLPLIYELRMMNIPVQDVGVSRGAGGMSNDKIARVNAVTDIFASGMVYATKDRTWAQEVIEECASFPYGENDDYVDTVTMALSRFRQGGWVGTDNDEDDEDETKKRRRVKEYY